VLYATPSIKQTLLGNPRDDGVPLEEKVARIRAKLDYFVASVAAPLSGSGQAAAWSR
jgi:hypothetical protein